MNGYFIASTRLLFSMGRGKFIPSWFEKVHPRHGTPVNAILFVLMFTLIAPWFGRAALNWLCDTCALGAALSYLFTCITAYKLAAAYPEMVMRSGRCISLIGVAISLFCFLLLSVPGSPAAIGLESWVMLLVWVALGVIFYLQRASELRAIPEREMQFMLLGVLNCRSFLGRKRIKFLRKKYFIKYFINYKNNNHRKENHHGMAQESSQND